MIRRWASAFATLTAVTLTASGCAATTSGQPRAAEIDVRTLDTGGMATVPFDLQVEGSHNLTAGKELAAMRLADHTITGRDIDPAIKYSLASEAIDHRSAVDLFWLPGLDANGVPDVFQREKMMFGYTYQATDSADRLVWEDRGESRSQLAAVTILQFPDAAAAARGAQELTDAVFAMAPGNQVVVLPGHGQAHTFQRPGQPVIESTLAYGSYVVNLLIRAKSPDSAALSALADKAYTAQLPMLDALAPLTGRAMLLQDRDTNGMLRRTLRVGTEAGPWLGREASYGPQAFLHSQHDVEWATAAMTAAGTDAFGYTDLNQNRTITARTRDDSAAASLAKALAGRPGLKPGGAPARVPDAFCFEDTTLRGTEQDGHVCFVRYRRYVAIVRSTQQVDAEQRAAAQYALFANCQ